jgi:O-antigen/teichoic acid export membrane protein
VVVLLLLVVVFQSSAQINTANALGIQFVAIVFAIIAVSWLLSTKQPEQLKVAISKPPPGLWVMACMPFLSITLISLLEAQAPLYILAYLGGAEQAGLYQAANQLVGIVAIGLVSVNMPLQPKLSAAWARSDLGQAQGLVTETARMAAGIGMIGVLLLLVFAEAILRLYGQQYIEASQALRILAIGQLVNALSGSCGIVLLMTGHQRIVVQGLAAALLLNFGVAYWAIPAFGMSGAALAVTVGIVFWNIYYVFSALNILGLNTTVFPIKNMANVRKS